MISLNDVVGRVCHCFPAIVSKVAAGTPAYCAPEVFTGEGYGQQVDLWSAGVVLYVSGNVQSVVLLPNRVAKVMLCGHGPFQATNLNSIQKEINRDSLEIKANLSKGRTNNDCFHFQTSYSMLLSLLEAKDLIRRLICVDVSKRISLETARQHEWFQMHGVEWSDAETMKCSPSGQSPLQNCEPWYGVRTVELVDDNANPTATPSTWTSHQQDTQKIGFSHANWESKLNQDEEEEEEEFEHGGWYFGANTE